MDDDTSDRPIARRDVLRASGGALGFMGMGGGGSERCPDATSRPAMRDCDGSTRKGCRDDHPRTEELLGAATESLDSDFDTVGALLEDGFVPYFDVLTGDSSGGWSHWLNPRYIGDDSIFDASRPAAIMVDNKWWRPLGLMFVATREGDRVSAPSVYGEDDEQRCSPWHQHVGLPGRYAWWKYRQLWGDGGDGFRLPCDTPCMMHVWTYPHPDGVYAHGAPPRENRGGPPAEPAGFETSATPGEDVLGIDVLAEELLNSSVARS
ncbi:hypothetical protein [Haloarcula marina]|uniref:hypothetical protein n=1 Tax=Haloarcula marina TaxID=2961574 RepID=UPI0020B657CF|nr:hypothetical protein [Halomicroarcula marina]